MLRTIREVFVVIAGTIAAVILLAKIEDLPPEFDRKTKPPQKQEEEKGDD